MNVPHMEPRDPETAKSRALVVDWTFARWLLGIVVAASLFIGTKAYQIGTLVENHTGRIAEIERTLEERKKARDDQIGALGDRIDASNSRINDRVDTINAGIDSRIRPLEITSASMANSMAFFREQITAANNKLDRLTDQLLGKNDK